MHARRSQLIAAVLALSLAAATGYAQTTQQPSAKVTAKSSNTVLIPPTTGTGGWVTVLENTIKMPQNKDIFVTAAFETGVFTRTDTPPPSTATARVQFRVLRDGQE